jgi:hypothetical protein
MTKIDLITNTFFIWNLTKIKASISIMDGESKKYNTLEISKNGRDWSNNKYIFYLKSNKN